ncbi:AraC family transcriptional regulator [Streptomyces sp. NPDC058691]|uniref:helix-turn-helix transcriptional regulator n=1 Tax=Streptomyces sp. NPDC058691 TaxID=3346601 RepID=UPI00364D8F8D
MHHWTPADPTSPVEAGNDAFPGTHATSRVPAMDRTASWTGRPDRRRAQTYGIALCTGGREAVTTRDARRVKADPRGTYELLVPLAGTARVEQGSSSGEIRPGDVALYDVDRPLTFVHTADFRSIAVIVPGRGPAGRSLAAARVPQVLSGAGGLGRVIRTMVTTLHEERGQLSETMFDLACERLLDLVCLAAESTGDATPAGQRVSVEAEILRYVRRHVCDDDLDIARIARALGWSPRRIQQVLQAAGTTARGLIRRERLLLARTRLAAASWAGHSITQIAYSCGFGSHASFSTAFRQEFGMTPRQARYGVLPAPTSPVRERR